MQHSQIYDRLLEKKKVLKKLNEFNSSRFKNNKFDIHTNTIGDIKGPLLFDGLYDSTNRHYFKEIIKWLNDKNSNIFVRDKNAYCVKRYRHTFSVGFEFDYYDANEELFVNKKYENLKYLI